MLMMRTVWLDTSGTGATDACIACAPSRLCSWEMALMLMMRTVWFDTSGTGRLMFVLLVLPAFNAAWNWELMLMMRTVWFDTSGTGRLMFVLLVLLALCAWELARSLVWYFWDRATDACIACAPSLKAPGRSQLMLMMRTVWFDTSGTGRLMFVLLVLLVFTAAGKWRCAHDAHGLV